VEVAIVLQRAFGKVWCPFSRSGLEDQEKVKLAHTRKRLVHRIAGSTKKYSVQYVKNVLVKKLSSMHTHSTILFSPSIQHSINDMRHSTLYFEVICVG
jgi:galactose-1-phosphate uridylyltransferase